MRIVAILIFSLIPLSGCIALHAHLPEDVVRTMAREDGAELAAICSHDRTQLLRGRDCLHGRAAHDLQRGRALGPAGILCAGRLAGSGPNGTLT